MPSKRLENRPALEGQVDDVTFLQDEWARDGDVRYSVRYLRSLTRKQIRQLKDELEAFYYGRDVEELDAEMAAWAWLEGDD